MATPAMLPGSFSQTLIALNAGRLRVDTFAADGTALDVSAGYTVGSLFVYPANVPNFPDTSPINITSDMSAAFDTTGVTLTYTAAQANTISALLQQCNNVLDVWLSNDSGTTSSLAARGSFTVDNSGAN